MLRTLKDFEKCAIGATDGDVGHVKDLYFDDQAWVVRYLIVDTGTWLPARRVLISPISIRQADWAAHRLPATITRNQVQDSPDIDIDMPVSRQHEAQYLGYYGYPNYWGEAGLWGGGMIPFAMAPGSDGLPGSAAARDAAILGRLTPGEAAQSGGDPHLRSCNAVLRYHLHASDGEIGHVEGYLIDDETWAIRYLVVNTSNWWFGHQVLIAPPWISGVHWTDRTVSVDLSRGEVKASPPFDLAADLDRARELGLHTHYQKAPYWTVGPELEREI